MAKLVQRNRVLYFIDGPMPSQDDRDGALALAGLGKDVVFRNVALIKPDECVEAFDELAGIIPPNYAKAAELKEQAAKVAAFHDSDAPANVGTQTPKAAAKAAAKAAKTSGKTEKLATAPVEDPAKAAALAALGGGTGGQEGPAAPAAPVTPPNVPEAGLPGTLSGQGELMGGGAPAPGGNPPAWKPNA